MVGQKRITLLLGAGVALAVFAACGGIGSKPMTPEQHIEMARRVAAHPTPDAFPELLSAYEPELGAPSTSGSNAAGRFVHHVWVPLKTSLGPVPIGQVRLGFGPPGLWDNLRRDDPLDPDLHVLLEIYVEIPATRCGEVSKWLHRGYGRTPYPGRWDGITHAILLRGPGRTASCSIWWTYWFPDNERPWTLLGRRKLPPEWGHTVEPDMRVPYGRAWLDGAARVLRGESVETVMATLDTSALDEQHREELAHHLRRLEAPTR